MQIRLTRSKEGLVLSGPLPSELSQATSLELFPLRDGAYLLLARGMLERISQDTARPAPALSEKEKELLKKLSAIRFEERLPGSVSKILTGEEKATLEGLLKKNVVHVFHRGKYAKSGVYNISDYAFLQVYKSPAAAEPHDPPVSSTQHLERFGWMVLDSEPAARFFTQSYSDKLKSGAVAGVRSFDDKKFYFVSKGFLEQHGKPLQGLLGKDEKTEEEISAQLGIPLLGCRALLFHLCEAGDILEKRKGRFARA